MQIQFMKEFLVLAQTLNYLSAADQLYISQATLSKHIKELEKELGAPLFRRSTRKVALTELGIRLVPYAQQMTNLQGKMLKEVEDYKERLNNCLSIGCVNYWDDVDLGKLTMDFQQTYPNIHIMVTTDESEELLEMLVNGFCSFTFIRELSSASKDGIERFQICEDPLYVFLPKDHPLSGSRSLSLSQLKDESFLMGADGSLSYQMGVQACKEAGFLPNIIYRGERVQTFRYLSRGLGVGLMFGNPMAPVERGSIVKIPLEPSINAKINLAYAPGTLTDAGKTFLKFVKNYDF